MIEKDIQVINQLGLHARASAKLVQLVCGYRSEVMMAAKGRDINAKSIMGILSGGIAQGSKITIEAEGPDAQEAVDELVDLIENGFDDE